MAKPDWLSTTGDILSVKKKVEMKEFILGSESYEFKTPEAKQNMAAPSD